MAEETEEAEAESASRAGRDRRSLSQSFRGAVPSLVDEPEDEVPPAALAHSDKQREDDRDGQEGKRHISGESAESGRPWQRPNSHKWAERGTRQ